MPLFMSASLISDGPTSYMCTWTHFLIDWHVRCFSEQMRRGQFWSYYNVQRYLFRLIWKIWVSSFLELKTNHLQPVWGVRKTLQNGPVCLFPPTWGHSSPLAARLKLAAESASCTGMSQRAWPMLPTELGPTFDGHPIPWALHEGQPL